MISVHHSLKIIEVLPMVIMYMSPQAKKEMSLHNFKNVKFVNIIRIGMNVFIFLSSLPILRASTWHRYLKILES
jgi:hypothetical protein